MLILFHLSPKAQYILKKVSDFHKSGDIFAANQSAKIRELLIPYVKLCKSSGSEPSQKGFQDWINEEVQDPNFKLAVTIESFYGTSLWLFHAGVRANNPKLTIAARRVFSGLFHIMGNRNYSQIEVFDEHLVRKCEESAADLADDLKANAGTNLTGEPYSAQQNDAQQEELNKKGQNIFQGEEAEDFQRSFNILDDIYEMKANMSKLSDVNDPMDYTNKNVQDLEPLVQKILVGIRKSNSFLEPLVSKELVSMTGDPLNPVLKNLYKLGVESRDKDIRR